MNEDELHKLRMYETDRLTMVKVGAYIWMFFSIVGLVSIVYRALFVWR